MKFLHWDWFGLSNSEMEFSLKLERLSKNDKFNYAIMPWKLEDHNKYLNKNGLTKKNTN